MNYLKTLQTVLKPHRTLNHYEHDAQVPSRDELLMLDVTESERRTAIDETLHSLEEARAVLECLY